MKTPKLIFTVINDLNFDQRMIRICTSLQQAGYDVTLVGREHPESQPLIKREFHQQRLKVRPDKGKMMYFLYWVKLFFYLCFKKADVLCATDLDSILPVYFASLLKGSKRVYDAHELFTEMNEVVSRPKEKAMWERIERFTLPKFPVGYTIGDFYAAYFREKYGLQYAVIRNATVLKPLERKKAAERFILYQGAVNVGRCFEYLVPAMKNVDAPLVVCGAGNFFEEAKALTRKLGLEHKITFKGYLPPEALKEYTERAYIGLTLFEAVGISNKLSMANRYFDYMHHAVPQLAMAFPEYEKVNAEFEIAYLIPEPDTENITRGLQRLLQDELYHQQLTENALKARERYCWQAEEKKLLKIYDNLIHL
jgi:glycosyltransferase involved in cell wall biosynthesis